MGRKYPRFLLSQSVDTKSKGTYILHTLSPRFLCTAEFDTARNLTDITNLEFFDGGTWIDAYNLLPDIQKWFIFSGRQYSNNPKDKVICALFNLPFLTVPEEHYTVDQAREIIKICFPNKAKAINRSHSSYGFKHDLERISCKVMGHRNFPKYCSNQTMKKAFELEGFESETEGPNCYYNVFEKEVTTIKDITAAERGALSSF